MIFAARQLQEKCREQKKDLYLVFIDLTKAFDSVSREGLWQVLRRLGCSDKFFKVVQSFHDGMIANVLENGATSKPFTVSNSVKQGCVLAPALFLIFFSVMLQSAFKDCDKGIYIQFRTDGSVFNLRRLQARTKLLHMLIRELLFADDCALAAHTLEDTQALVSKFSAASKSFGLSINLKKTEVLYQPAPGNTRIPSTVTVDSRPLQFVASFTYLGSAVSSNAMIDDEVDARIARASAAFGRLTARLWKVHDVRLQTKLSVYNAAVLPSLLCDSETSIADMLKN